MVRVHLWISGRVQGVYFRWHIKSWAQELGVKGWVKNLIDGRVEAVFEGEARAVDELIERCRSGPPGAAVEKVKVVNEPFIGEFDTFQIRY